MLRWGMWPSVVVITTFSVFAAEFLAWLMLWVIDAPLQVRPTVLWIAALIPLIVATVVGVVLMRMLVELDAARRLVQEMAITDALTGIFNRRRFMELADAEFAKAGRHDLPLSVLMVDADHFKAINDVYGHVSGDEVLRQIALATKNCVRAEDMLARYGGEEFVVLLPLTGTHAAMVVAERVRVGVGTLRIDSVAGVVLQVTVSIGVATRTPETKTLNALIDSADKALYCSKTHGRNRVECGEQCA